jgi:TDG/mug DNA glycosylase family protein
VDRRTVDAYSTPEAAQRYVDRRGVYDPAPADRLAARAAGWRIDIGCGPGHYTELLGAPLVSLDASEAMLRHVGRGALVCADFTAMPFRRGALGGAWAWKTYQHVPHEALPLALADLHRALELDAPIAISLFTGDGTRITDGDDDFPGRLFSWWDPDRLRAAVEGAGFVIDDVVTSGTRHIEVRATRARMLPDFVRPGLRVLFCGYNPSLYAADKGVPFARPGNRFWPAALASGVLTVDRDPWDAVRRGVGFTDMVKRASVAAAELSKDELRAGFDRVTRVCEWLAPEVICFLGIGGWRELVNKKATVGWQPETVGSSRVYVMPNPSGLNASTQHEGYVEHLRAMTQG